MMRLVVGVAAWVAVTAIAVSVAWFGANVVLADAGVGQGVPVVNAAPSIPPAATPAPPPGAGPGSVGGAVSTSPSPGVPASGGTGTGPRTGTAAYGGGTSHSPTMTPAAGSVHAYTLTGGRVTLNMTAGAVQLVSAVPNAEYSVRTWSGTGWLRVDFSSGVQVSSLIASWYQHAPTVTIEN
jgi:hypothetical protein